MQGIPFTSNRFSSRYSPKITRLPELFPYTIHGNKFMLVKEVLIYVRAISVNVAY